ncbi:MAG: hypothetical protein RML56_08745 [Burkholderiales bacterium]|nr:hypothetical protein [Burkholderiales bacterium]
MPPKLCGAHEIGHPGDSLRHARRERGDLDRRARDRFAARPADPETRRARPALLPSRFEEGDPDLRACDEIHSIALGEPRKRLQVLRQPSFASGVGDGAGDRVDEPAACALPEGRARQGARGDEHPSEQRSSMPAHVSAPSDNPSTSYTPIGSDFPFTVIALEPADAHAGAGRLHGGLTGENDALHVFCQAFEPRGGVHGVADGGVLLALRGADVADDGLAGVKPHADRELGKPAPGKTLAHPVPETLGFARHRERGADRPPGVVRVAHRRAEDGHDRIAEVFVHGTPFGEDRAAGAGEVGVQQLDDLVRRELFRERRETADVGIKAR